MQFIASASGTQSWGSTITASSTLNVAIGDILVLFVGLDGETLSSAAQTDGNNSFTVVGNTTEWYKVGSAYCIATSANSSATIRATLSAAAAGMVIVLQFRPGTGETITYGSGPAGAQNASSANPTSAQISSSGAAMFVGGVMCSAANPSGNQIGGGSPDGTVEASLSGSGYTDVSYRAFASAQTNITYSTTASASTWGAQMLYFTITSGGGSSPVRKIMTELNQFNGGMTL